MNVSFLSVNTQFENLGDALINRELVKLLAANGRVVVDVGKAPEWFVNMLELPVGVECVFGRRLLFFSLLKERAAGNAVYYFFMPGGAFGEISFLGLVKKLALLIPFFLLKLVGVRFCNVGLSYERLGKKFKIFLRTRGWIMHKVFVRDDESSSILDCLGVKHGGVIPDLAFNIFTVPPVVKDEVSRVCFSFRTDQHLAQLDECCSFVEKVIRNLGGDVRVFFSVQVDRDLSGMNLIRQRIEGKIGRSVGLVHNSRNINDMLSFYGEMDIVVSNRLHVLLLAASVSGRVLAYADSQNRKISGLFETIGRKDLVMGRDSSEYEVEQALSAAALRGDLQCQKLREGIEAIYK